MPRPTAKRMDGRSEIRDQDTFDFSIPNRDTQARPVDAYEQPEESHGAENVARFINSMTDTGLMFLQEETVRQKEKGALSQQKGEEKPEDANWAFIAGYEQMQGKASVAEYEMDMIDLFNRNWQDDPETFRKKQEAVTRKYLNGASDSFVRGFVKDATEIEAAYDKKYQKAQWAQTQQNFLDNVGKVTSVEFRKMLRDPNVTDYGDGLRSLVSSLQAEGKNTYGLSRSEVAEKVVDTIGEAAVQYGRPDFLKFVAHQDKESGISLADTDLQGKIYDYLRGAEATKASIEAAEKAEKKENLKLAKESAEKYLVDLWAESRTDKNSIARFHSQLMGLRDILDPNDYAKYREMGVDLMTGYGFAKDGQSNPQLAADAWATASQGQLTDKDMQVIKEGLDRDTWTSIVKHNEASKRYFDSRVDGEFVTRWNGYVRDLVDIVNTKDALGGLLDPTGGPRRAQKARHLMGLYLDEYRKEHGDQKPPPTLMMEWSQRVQKTIMDETGGPGQPSVPGKPTSSAGDVDLPDTVPVQKLNPVSKRSLSERLKEAKKN